ncbi:hypothetical protein ABVT39_011243 [Epinephelus coioides]
MEEDKQNPEHRSNKVRRRQAAGSSSDSSHVEVSVDDVMDKKGLTHTKDTRKSLEAPWIIRSFSGSTSHLEKGNVTKQKGFYVSVFPVFIFNSLRVKKHLRRSVLQGIFPRSASRVLARARRRNNRLVGDLKKMNSSKDEMKM